MRVTNTATYRNFTTSVNSVHQQLNRSLNKISSGELYEKAAESPLSYYRGKRIDDQYLDALGKSTLLTDIKNRLYQQELGARDIQKILANGKNKVQEARTGTSSDESLQTLRDDLLQKQHEIIDDLNAQYENFYIYGGNDLSTPPFSLSADGKTLTFSHSFPQHSDAENPVTITMELKYDQTTPYSFEITGATTKDGTAINTNDAQDLIIAAMSEQGRMDIGYGDIRDRETLLDTFTGGFNVLTGLNSDKIINLEKDTTIDTWTEIQNRLNKSPLALIGGAVQAIDTYLAVDPTDPDARTAAKEQLHKDLGTTIQDMTETKHWVSTVYSDLGNKYRLLEDTDTKLKTLQDSLTEQYTNLLGADPYESIMEMYNNQYAYNAALRVGNNLMNTSLFDFVR